MYALMELSGQEYVDTYATKKAEGLPSEVARIESVNGHAVNPAEKVAAAQ